MGKVGQNSLFPCGPDLDEAKQIFCNKLVAIDQHFSEVVSLYSTIETANHFNLPHIFSQFWIYLFASLPGVLA